jgi:hypothetical protein
VTEPDQQVLEAAAAPDRRPLSRRDDPSYEAPYVGMPRWLIGSLLEWIEPQVRWRALAGDPIFNVPLLREIERRLRTPLSWARGPAEAFDYLACLMRFDPAYAFDVVDLLLRRLPAPATNTQVEALARILAEGGAVYAVSVSDAGARLERRS